MAKESKLDKAITSLEGEIAVLQLAIGKLKAQRDLTPRKGRPAKVQKIDQAV